MVTMTPFELLYYAAASWAVSYMVTQTQGAFGMFVKLREWRKGKWHGRVYEPSYVLNVEGIGTTKIGEVQKYHGLLDCIICTMPWVALILHTIGANVITDALAIAGVALLLHGFTGWRINMEQHNG